MKAAAGATGTLPGGPDHYESPELALTRYLIRMHISLPAHLEKYRAILQARSLSAAKASATVVPGTATAANGDASKAHAANGAALKSQQEQQQQQLNKGKDAKAAPAAAENGTGAPQQRAQPPHKRPGPPQEQPAGKKPTGAGAGAGQAKAATQQAQQVQGPGQAAAGSKDKDVAKKRPAPEAATAAVAGDKQVDQQGAAAAAVKKARLEQASGNAAAGQARQAGQAGVPSKSTSDNTSPAAAALPAQSQGTVAASNAVDPLHGQPAAPMQRHASALEGGSQQTHSQAAYEHGGYAGSPVAAKAASGVHAAASVQGAPEQGTYSGSGMPLDLPPGYHHHSLMQPQPAGATPHGYAGSVAQQQGGVTHVHVSILQGPGAAGAPISGGAYGGAPQQYGMGPQIHMHPDTPGSQQHVLQPQQQLGYPSGLVPGLQGMQSPGVLPTTSLWVELRAHPRFKTSVQRGVAVASQQLDSREALVPGVHERLLWKGLVMGLMDILMDFKDGLQPGDALHSFVWGIREKVRKMLLVSGIEQWSAEQWQAFHPAGILGDWRTAAVMMEHVVREVYRRLQLGAGEQVSDRDVDTVAHIIMALKLHVP